MFDPGESVDWVPTSVSDIRFESSDGYFKFKVHWKATKECRKPDTTWEPIENIQARPDLLLDYQKRFRSAWMAECSAGRACLGGSALRREPMENMDIPVLMASQWNLEGHEQLKRICAVMHCGEPRGEDTAGYWNMVLVELRGHGRNRKHWVHRIFLEYYFPVHFALYLEKHKCKMKLVDEEVLNYQGQKPSSEAGSQERGRGRGGGRGRRGGRGWGGGRELGGGRGRGKGRGGGRRGRNTMTELLEK